MKTRKQMEQRYQVIANKYHYTRYWIKISKIFFIYTHVYVNIYILFCADLTMVPTYTQIQVRTSGADVRPKELILVCLALMLLVFSVALFFKHWRKNYYDINQLPYYAYLCKVCILK